MDHPIRVTSEIGKLKTVLLHRPGKELEGLMPANLDDLLFDDIPDLKQAREEHDRFTNVLRGRGVEVLYLDQLATEALGRETLREQFVDEMIRLSKQGSRRATDTLKTFLLDLPTHAMVRKVMAGIRKDEITLPPEHYQQLHSMVEKDSHPFYLDPMPNLYFTRDSAAVIGNGLAISKMKYPARRREPLFIEYVMKYHDQFASAQVPEWYRRDEKFSLEGGDQLVLSSDTVAMGISQRTTAEAIESATIALFKNSEIRRVIAFDIPKNHAFKHLDTVLAMIDHDTFIIHPGLRKSDGKVSMFVLDRVEGQAYPQISREYDIEHVLRTALSLPKVRLIELGGGDQITAAREQWNAAVNVLVIAPGVVVAYDRNHATNQQLREQGIEVIEVPGSELVRGRGGLRCMSTPLVREDV